MAIITEAQFKAAFDIERVEQLATQYDASVGSDAYDASIITAIIAQAQGLVYNTLAMLYTTTQLDADTGIQRLTLDIAMYYLELRRNDVSPSISQTYKIAYEQLNALKDGTMVLVGTVQLLPTGETDLESVIDNSDLFDNYENF